MYKHVSRLGRIAVIALPLLILPVGSWGAEKVPPKASPPAQEGLVLSSRDTLLDLYLKGGVVMHIITLCSILALAVLFERLVNLKSPAGCRREQNRQTDRQRSQVDARAHRPDTKER